MAPVVKKKDYAAVIRRRHPEKFGELEDVDLFNTYKTRQELSHLNIHPPREQGMFVGENREGISSVIMSGGYDDDLDDGDTVLYTGTGGRDRSTTKQVTDQSFRNPLNACLRKNIDAELPVRLFRGYGLKSVSVFAPMTGYRYDGLYSVVEAELVEGKHKKKICRFTLKRIVPSKGPLPKIPTRGDVPGPSPHS